MALCPVDLRKLCSVFGVDPVDRYVRLRVAYEDLGWTPELAFVEARLDALMLAEVS